MEPAIHLVGIGMTAPLQITPEAMDALSGCRRVFHMTAYHDLLEDFCQEVVDLTEEFLARTDASIFEDMAVFLLEEAVEEPPIGFAITGHPLVVVETSRRIIEMSVEKEMSVNIVPGISPVDVLLKYLMLDVGLAGLQLLDPNHMVVNQILPSPYTAVLLLYIDGFASADLGREIGREPERFQRLVDFLLQSYQPDHPAVLIDVPFVEGMSPRRFDFRLEELPQAATQIHPGMNLFLPPMRSRSTNVHSTILRSYQ